MYVLSTTLGTISAPPRGRNWPTKVPRRIRKGPFHDPRNLPPKRCPTRAGSRHPWRRVKCDMGVGAVSIGPHRSDACRPHVHPKSIENGCGGGTAFRTTLTQPSVKQRRIGETKGERKETLRLPFGFPLVSCGPRSVPAGVVEFPCGFPLVSCATPSVAAGVVESPVGFLWFLVASLRFPMA